MNVPGLVDPTRVQSQASKGCGRARPSDRIKRVRFRASARCHGTHDLARDGLTGAEACALHDVHPAAILAQAGAKGVGFA